jgi:carbonic anhydrase/acetyltransferase-like protein (isoleucine patch superfamily)
MLHTLQGKTPQVAESAYIAPGAHVIGDVVIGAHASIWFNAVVRGDIAAIRIGEGTNIQDNTTVHCDYGMPTTIGSHVVVGHNCIIHGCTIADNVLVGMGSTILNGAQIGENCLIGAGSLVTEGKVFPPGSVIMGRPAKVVRAVGEKELAMIKQGPQNYMKNAALFKESGIGE